MSKSKIGNQQSAIANWQELDRAMAAHAARAAMLSKRRAALEDALQRVRATYAEEIAEYERLLAETAAALEEFTVSRKAEFKAAPDGDGRSYEAAGVIIGFRKLLDKVGLPRGEAKKQVALEYLLQYRPEFVRRTPEFDLIALLAALKDGDADLVRALDEKAGITLKPGKDEFFLKVAQGS